MKLLRLTEPSLAKFLQLIEEQPTAYRHLFRGQSDATWNLVPSLYRNTPPFAGGTVEQNFDRYEDQMVRRFFDEGMPYLPALRRSFSNDRIVAQHFGVPTRLLDWTRDPLIALYFALEDVSATTDAAVFMLSPDAYALPDEVVLSGHHQAIAFDPPALDRRIIAQKSAFTFHPFGSDTQNFLPLDERADFGNEIAHGPEGARSRGFAKIAIPGYLKRKLKQHLSSLRYDRRSLFPGLDGVGHFVAQTGGLDAYI